MHWPKPHPVLLITLVLLVVLFLLFMPDKEPDRPQAQEVVVSERFRKTGFVDYDLLPAELKEQMETRVKNDTIHQYRFYYFFEANDINHHYYLEDRPLEIVARMPVTDRQVLDRVDEILHNIEAKAHGLFVAHNNTRYQKHKQEAKAAPLPIHKSLILYVLPEGTADFSKMHVGIVKETANQERFYPKITDTTLYELDEVDVPPRPLRGMDYFQEAVRNEAHLDVVLALYDTGTVTVEFFVGVNQVQAIDVVQGLNDWNNSYEAYQADSEFMKAVHKAKVLWKPGIRNGQLVKTRMKITFTIDAGMVSTVVHPSFRHRTSISLTNQ